MLCTVCDTSREEIRILIRVESKNRVESNELARVRPRGDRPITVIAIVFRIVPIESSRVKNFKRKRKKKRRGRRKERRNRAKSKKGANNGSGVSLRGNRRRVLGGLKMGLPGLINHRQSRESASKRPRPLKVNDENFVTGRSVRTMVDRGGPVICFHSTPLPRQGKRRK